MDDVEEKYVDDDSGKEMHGTANGPKIARGIFTRGRYFNGTGNIEIPHNDAMNLLKSDFSFCGWIKVESHLNPLTTFAVEQGLGCDYTPVHTRMGYRTWFHTKRNKGLHTRQFKQYW